MANITVEAIADCIRTKRPDLSVEINEVVKNKQTFQGLTIKSQSVNIAPNIYVEGYLKKFSDVDSIADAILNTYEEHKCFDGFNVADILNKDFILSHVIPVMQQESDEPLIKLPNVSDRFKGAEAYLAIVSDTDENASYSIKLNPQILASADINIESDRLFEHAIENLKNKVVIKSMFETLKQITGLPDDILEPYDAPINMYVCSLSPKYKGASAILCDDALTDFAKEHNIKDGFFILPSSVFETIFVWGDNIDIDSLSDMVVSVNENEVAPEDRLSDTAWFYKL